MSFSNFPKSSQRSYNIIGGFSSLGRNLNPFSGGAKFEAMQKHGETLLKRLLTPEDGFGGHLTLVIGAIGRGKTSILLTLAKAFAKKGFIVVYRGRVAFELYRLPRYKKYIKILMPAKHWYKFTKHEEGRKKEIRYEVTTYENLQDLMHKLERGKINVIYASKRIDETWIRQNIPRKMRDEAKEYWDSVFWTELFEVAIKELAGKRIVFIIDEIHELWPGGASGALWHITERAKHRIADFRKFRFNLVAATHDPADLDWRLVKKFDYAIYVRGARVLRRILKQSAVNKLQDGWALIEDPAEWGIFPFQRLSEKVPITVEWVPSRKLSEKEWGERVGLHRKAIIEVASEKGYFARQHVKEKLGELFSRDAYYYVLNELKKGGAVTQVKRGVYKFVEGA